MHANAKKWQTLLLAGTLTGALWSTSVVAGAALPGKGNMKLPVRQDEIAGLPLSTNLYSGFSVKIQEAAIDNAILAVLNKLDLTDEQIAKGLTLLQAAKTERQNKEDQLEGLLAQQRKALLAEDQAAMKDIQKQVADFRQEYVEWSAKVVKDAAALLTDRQRKLLEQMQSNLPGKTDLVMPRMQQRLEIRGQMGPGMWPGFQRTLPRWHPNQDLSRQPTTGRLLLPKQPRTWSDREFLSVDMLSRLEKLLQELQAARTDAPTQTTPSTQI